MTTLAPEPSPEKHKPKGRAGRTFPVTFVVDQQLEACLEAITRNGNQPDLMIKVPYNARKDDSVAFSAILFQDGVALRRIKGSLRRWQGTSTRVEVTVTTVNALPWPRLSKDIVLMAIGVYLFYIATPALVIASVVPNLRWLFSLICGFGFILSLSVIPAAILFEILRRYRLRRSQIKRLREAFSNLDGSGITL